MEEEGVVTYFNVTFLQSSVTLKETNYVHMADMYEIEMVLYNNSSDLIIFKLSCG